MNTRNLLSTLLAFGLVASTLLAPLRLGIFEIIRPTLLITLPCAVCLLMLATNPVGKLFQTRMGLCVPLFCLLLTTGHLLGNDVFGLNSEEGSTLDVFSIWTMLLVFMAAMELGDPKYRPGLFLGLSFGLVVHIIGVILIPPSIHFRDYGRSAGLLHDPNILTIHLVPVFFIWVALLPRGIWQSAGPVGALLVSWATLQTLSRAGLVSLASAILVCACGILHGLGRSILRWRSFTLTTAALGAVLTFYAFNRSFLDERLEGHLTRAKEIMDKQGSMLDDRLIWWQDMQRLEPGELLAPFGIGYSRFLSTDILPHNTFVDTLIIAGPLALLTFMALFLAVLFKAASAVWHREHTDISSFFSAAILAAVASHILILNSLSVLSGKVNWLILGLVYGLLQTRSAHCTAESTERDGGQITPISAETLPAET